MRRKIRATARWCLLVWMCAVPARTLAQDSPTATVRAGDARADTAIALSLSGALDRALDRSEEVRQAGARVAQARADLRIARARELPRLNALLSYTRTFESPFRISDTGVPDVPPFVPDTTLPLEQRVRLLEQAIVSGSAAVFAREFGDLPFGREHTWIAALDGEWLAWSGGRVDAEVDAARDALDAARANLAQAESDVALAVKEAYYGALLADQRVSITRATLEQAQQEVDIARERFEAGDVARLDLLRAQVERDNALPPVDDALNTLDASLTELKRLVELPLPRPVELTTTVCPPGDGAPELPKPEAAVAEIDDGRAAVRAAREELARREAEARAERADRLPTVTTTGRFGGQAFPTPIFPGFDDWRGDWFLGVRVDWPVFTGRRRSAEIQRAEALAREAAVELERVGEEALADYIVALEEVTRARDEIDVLGRTVGRARRVYDLTVLRYEEGLGIQLEVTEARVILEQARTNLAEALHDYYVALARAEYALGRPIADTATPVEVCADPGGQGRS